MRCRSCARTWSDGCGGRRDDPPAPQPAARPVAVHDAARRRGGPELLHGRADHQRLLPGRCRLRLADLRGGGSSRDRRRALRLAGHLHLPLLTVAGLRVRRHHAHWLPGLERPPRRLAAGAARPLAAGAHGLAVAVLGRPVQREHHDLRGGGGRRRAGRQPDRRRGVTCCWRCSCHGRWPCRSSSGCWKRPEWRIPFAAAVVVHVAAVVALGFGPAWLDALLHAGEGTSRWPTSVRRPSSARCGCPSALSLPPCS